MEKQYPYPYQLVVALDLGTAYSGYAYSFSQEYKTEPLKIHVNQAWNSGWGRTCSTLKTPTCLLLNANKELDSFGYEAEHKYADIVTDKEKNNYYYFHRFKMKLHTIKNITTDMVLEDITGKSVPAIDVFALSIKALVNHLTDMLDKLGVRVKKPDMHWVLTVPAIWTDAAKQFMRKSAMKAGIRDEQLLIALEPEAASIYCQHLPTEKLHGAYKGFNMTNTGAKYMVIDLGGGNVDITVYEKLANDQLKELCRAKENDCGGTSVDGKFFQMLTKIFGGPLMKTMKDDDLEAYLELFREFETAKRRITHTTVPKVYIRIPFESFDEKCESILGEHLKEVLKSSTYSNQIKFVRDKLQIDASLIKSLFEPTIENIILLIEDVFKDKATSEVSDLILVGEFSECMLIQDAITRHFEGKTIIVPEDAGLSVLKGAVLFGHTPQLITSRLSQYTYGIETSRVFDPTIHDKKYLDDSTIPHRCSHLFSKLVEKYQKVGVEEKVTEYYTTIPMHKCIKLKMYRSTDESPMYTDESSCSYHAIVIIYTPYEDIREVMVEYRFGGIEIGLDAFDLKTMKKLNSSLDFLHFVEF